MTSERESGTRVLAGGGSRRLPTNKREKKIRKEDKAGRRARFDGDRKRREDRSKRGEA